MMETECAVLMVMIKETVGYENDDDDDDADVVEVVDKSTEHVY